MPCRDGGPPGPSLRDRLDEVTRYLCTTLARLEALGFLNSLSLEIREWWAKHQEEDARRRAEERQLAARLAVEEEVREYRNRLLAELEKNGPGADGPNRRSGA